MSNDIKADLLQEAHDMVTGPRAESYGEAAANHSRIADMWNVWMRNRSWAKHGVITPYDVAMMMGLVKFARCQHHPAHDSHCDIAGYAAIAEDIYEQIMEAQEDGGKNGTTTQDDGA